MTQPESSSSPDYRLRNETILNQLSTDLQQNDTANLKILAVRLKDLIERCFIDSYVEYNSLTEAQTRKLLSLLGQMADLRYVAIKELYQFALYHIEPVLSKHCEVEDKGEWPTLLVALYRTLSQGYLQLGHQEAALWHATAGLRLAENYQLPTDSFVTSINTCEQALNVAAQKKLLQLDLARLTQQISICDLTVEDYQAIWPSFQAIANYYYQHQAWVSLNAWYEQGMPIFRDYWQQRLLDSLASIDSTRLQQTLAEFQQAIQPLHYHQQQLYLKQEEQEQGLFFFLKKLAADSRQTLQRWRYQLDLDTLFAAPRHEPQILTYEPAWQNWRQRLKTLRQQLTKSHDIEVYSQGIQGLLRDMLQHIEISLGHAPCGFCVLGLGSLTRQAVSLNSDVELALLLESPDYSEHPYFTAYITRLRTHLISLGNAWQLGSDGYYQGLGFYLDADVLDGVDDDWQLKPKLRQDIAGYANWLQETANQIKAHEDVSGFAYFIYALLRATAIYSNTAGEPLYANYQAMLIELNQTTHQAIASYFFTLHQHEYVRGLNRPSDTDLSATYLKTHFLKPLEYWCLDVAYHQAQLTSGLSLSQLLDKLILKAPAADAIKQAYRELQTLRLQLLDNQALSPEQRQRVDWLQNYILQPLYQSLADGIVDAAMADPFIYHLIFNPSLPADTLPLARWTAYHLSKRQAPAELHLAAYQRLAGEARQHYYHSLKHQQAAPALLYSLGQLADASGHRPYWVEAYGRWFDKLVSAEHGSSRLTIAGHKQPYPLAATVSNRIWDSKKQQPKPTEHPGNHPVYGPIQQGSEPVFFKLYPGMPGLDFAIQRLYWRIVGGGTPWTTLARLDLAGNKQPVPVLLSQAIEGENLAENPLTEERLTQLDPYHLSQMLLMAILTNPEDGKLDNYKLVKTGPFYRLISIDNDQGLVDAEHPEGNQKPFVKTLLFCLDAMQTPLHPQAVKEFLQLNPKQLLESWLKELQVMGHYYESLFNATERDVYAKHSQLLRRSYLQIQFPTALLAKLYTKFTRLQALLEINSTLSPLELLSEVEPSLYATYGDILTKHRALSPTRRFTQLVKTYKLYDFNPKTQTYSTTKTLASQLQGVLVPEDANAQVTPQQALKFLERFTSTWEAHQAQQLQLLQGQLAQIKHLPAAEQSLLLSRIKLSSLNAAKRKALLDFIGQRKLKQIVLRCDALLLTDSRLGQVLKSSHELEELKLSRCDKLTDGFIAVVNKQTPRLQHLLLKHLAGISQLNSLELQALTQLTLKHLPNLNRFGQPYTSLLQPEQQPNLLALTKLTVLACDELQTLYINAPKLEYLVLEKLARLTHVQTSSQVLKQLHVKDCPKLTPAGLAQVVNHTQAMEVLELSESPLLQEVKWLEQCPPWLAFINHAPGYRQRLKQALELVQSTLETQWPIQLLPNFYRALFSYHVGYDISLQQTAKERLLSLARKAETAAIYEAFGEFGQDDSNILKVLVKASNRTGALAELTAFFRQQELEHLTMSAAIALAQLGQADKTVVDALIKALGLYDSTVQAEAVKALVQLGQADISIVDALIRALGYYNSTVRAKAAIALAQLGQADISIVDALIRALAPYNSTDRAEAVKALAQLGQADKTIVNTLIEALGRYDSTVRAEVAITLVQLGQVDKAVVDVLIEALGRYDSTFRAEIAIVLAQLGQADKTIVDTLIEALGRYNSTVRAEAVKALVQLGQADKTVIDALIKTLGRHNSSVWAEAAIVLAQLGQADKTIVDTLIEALGRYNSTVRAEAVKALVQLGQADKTVIDALIKALGNYDSTVRAEAAIALVQLGQADKMIVDTLIKTLGNDASIVRAEAAIALVQLGQADKTVVDALIDALEQHEVARLALIQFGKVNKAIIQGLTKMVSVDNTGNCIKLAYSNDLLVKVAHDYCKNLGANLTLLLTTELSFQKEKISAKPFEKEYGLPIFFKQYFKEQIALMPVSSGQAISMDAFSSRPSLIAEKDQVTFLILPGFYQWGNTWHRHPTMRTYVLSTNVSPAASYTLLKQHYPQAEWIELSALPTRPPEENTWWVVYYALVLIHTGGDLAKLITLAKTQTIENLQALMPELAPPTNKNEQPTVNPGQTSQALSRVGLFAEPAAKDEPADENSLASDPVLNFKR